MAEKPFTDEYLHDIRARFLPRSDSEACLICRLVGEVKSLRAALSDGAAEREAIIKTLEGLRTDVCSDEEHYKEERAQNLILTRAIASIRARGVSHEAHPLANARLDENESLRDEYLAAISLLETDEAQTFNDKTCEMMFYAFRHCLGRRSFAVHSCVEFLVANWDRLMLPTRLAIEEEIKEAFEQGRYGDEMDKEQWQRILDLPVQEK
jgi:hypothetical protein